jgi:hypothetical protein
MDYCYEGDLFPGENVILVEIIFPRQGIYFNRIIQKSKRTFPRQGIYIKRIFQKTKEPFPVRGYISTE